MLLRVQDLELSFDQFTKGPPKPADLTLLSIERALRDIKDAFAKVRETLRSALQQKTVYDILQAPEELRDDEVKELLASAGDCPLQGEANWEKVHVELLGLYNSFAVFRELNSGLNREEKFTKRALRRLAKEIVAIARLGQFTIEDWLSA